MNRALRTVTLLVIASVVYVLPVMAQGQSAESSQPSDDFLTCSPAPCVLPPTQAAADSYPTFDGVIVADPTNTNDFLLGNIGGKCGSMGAYFSTDADSTWTLTACMGNIITQRGRGVYYPAGQPMVAYDLHGNAYVAGEYIDSEGVGFGLVAFEKSRDSVNWSDPQLALDRGFYRVLDSWLTADTHLQSPYANSLYVSTVTLNEPSQRQNQVVVSHSNDGGAHWTLVPVDPIQFYPAFDRYTNMAVGNDGSVYVTWLHCPTGGPDQDCQKGTAYMLFSKSSDGGNTWRYPTIMAKISNGNCNCYLAQLPNTVPAIYFPDYAAIGVDNSTGPYAGNLYVSMFTWTGTQLQVLVVRSTDGGNTWSAPVAVAPSSDTHDQFLPWLSVSSTGLVGVSWLDRRNDPNNVNYQAFAAISKDGGQTFQRNVALTPKFSNPNLNGNDYLGDYAGNTWVGSTFLAVWPDTSNGINVQDVIGGVKLH